MLSGAERTYRYEMRKRAAGLRKVHIMVPEDRADELKAIAAGMRANHAGRIERGKLLKIIARWKPALRARGILGISLFGSIARDRATSASDIDLVVELDPAGELTILDLIDIEQELEKLLSRPVDLIDRAALKPEISSDIASDEARVF